LLHGTHLLLKRVVNGLLLAIETCQVIDHHLLVVAVVAYATLQLLLLYYVLDKGFLVHGDAVLFLKLVGVVVEEGLVPGHLLVDRHHAYLVESLLDAH